MKNPRMSPLLIPAWKGLSPVEQAKVIEDLKPVPKLKPGESFQVSPNGEFIRLKPGDPVPEIPIKVSDPKDPISDEPVIIP